MKVSLSKFSQEERQYIESVIDSLQWHSEEKSKDLGVTFRSAIANLPDGRQIMKQYHTDPSMGGYQKWIVAPVCDGVEYDKESWAFRVPSSVNWQLPHLKPQVRV